MPVRQYGMTVIVVAVAALLTWLLTPLREQASFMLFLLAITFSALYGSFRAGLMAIVLSAVLLILLGFGVQDLTGIEAGFVLVVFVLVAGLLVWLIDARKQALTALDEQRRWWQGALISLSDAVITTDSSGCITFLNQAAETLTGWRFTEARGQPLQAVFRTAGEQPALENRANTLSGPTRLIAKTGATVPIETSSAPIRDTASRTLGMVLVLRDMTERQRIEAALRASEEKLAKAFHASPLLLTITTLEDGRFVDVNNSALQVAGYTREEFIGRTPLELNLWVNPEQRERGLAALRAGTEPRNQEVQFRTKDGQIRTALISGALLDFNGQPCVLTAINDITERKQAEQALRISEETARQRLIELEAVYDTTPIGMCVLDRDLRYVRINKRLAEINGLPVEAHIGRTVREIVPALAETAEPLLRRVLETGEPVQNIEISGHTAATPEVERTWLENWFPLRDADGQIIGINIAVEDITQRKHTEETLRAQQRFTQSIIEVAPSVIYVFDLLEQRTIYTSAQSAHFFGYSPEEIASRGSTFLASVLHPDDAERMRTHWTLFDEATDDQIHEIEYRMRGKDGTWRWFISRDRLFSRTPAGQPQQLLGVAQDITKRKQAEERTMLLQAVTAAISEALTPQQVMDVVVRQGSAVLGAFAGLVALRSPDGTALHLAATSGYTEQALRSWQTLPLERLLPLTVAVRTGELVVIESADDVHTRFPDLHDVQHTSGSHSLVAVPFIAERQVVGVLGLSFAAFRTFDAEERALLWSLAQLCTQALERARLYEAEQQARAQAQAAVSLRDAFFSVAAHELRTPLTTLLGQVQLLQRRLARAATGDERMQRGLAVIADQSLRLNKMIVALLDAARIEMGRLSIEKMPFAFDALVQRIVDEVQPTLIQHTIVYHRPAAPVILYGDELRLEQVVQNLLQNAIKYSPTGGDIVITAAQSSDQLVLTVSDQGIGIPSSALPQLFQQFYRAPNAQAHQINGLGVGLFVIREIIMLHGGHIDVASEEGRGTTFTIVLPLAHTQSRSDGHHSKEQHA